MMYLLNREKCPDLKKKKKKKLHFKLLTFVAYSTNPSHSHQANKLAIISDRQDTHPLNTLPKK